MTALRSTLEARGRGRRQSRKNQRNDPYTKRICKEKTKKKVKFDGNFEPYGFISILQKDPRQCQTLDCKQKLINPDVTGWENPCGSLGGYFLQPKEKHGNRGSAAGLFGRGRKDGNEVGIWAARGDWARMRGGGNGGDVRVYRAVGALAEIGRGLSVFGDSVEGSTSSLLG